MKIFIQAKNAILCIAIFLSAHFASAQCGTIVVGPNTLQSPDTINNIAAATRGNSYQAIIQLYAPTSFSGFQVNNVSITGVTGVPSGFTVSYQPTNGVITAGNAGCVIIQSNNVTAALGTYPIVINTTVSSIIGNTPFPLNGYKIRVIQPAGNITSFNPTSAKTGDTVTINGSDFTGTTSVTFGGVAAQSFQLVNSTQIKAIVANGASGHVKISRPLGNDSLGGFSYIPPQIPLISLFLPISAGAGSIVSIVGANFTGATSVKFGNVEARSFTVTNSSQISATVDTGATGVVSVTTPLGTATLSGFTFLTSVQPTIASFMPTSASKGDTVAITGFNLMGTTSVKFGGVSAKSFSIINANLIAAVVDTGASGSISVVTANGTAERAGFTFIGPVVPIPAITSFTPTSAAQNDTVTIVGKKFTGANAVLFGGVKAKSFTVKSDSVIQAIVDTGATGNIIVASPLGSDTIVGFLFIGNNIGLEDMHQVSYSLFPNPTQSSITIISSKNLAGALIELIDITGKTALRQTIIEQGNTHNIDLSHVSNGWYLMHITTDNHIRKNIKVIKQ
jgi:predicted aspartyl protease